MPSTDIREVVGKLDLSEAVGALTDALSALTREGGPLSNVQLPVTRDELDAATEGAARVDATPVAGAVQSLAAQILPLASQLPDAGDAVRSIESAISAVEQVTSGDLFGQLQALAARLAGELSAPREKGFLGTLERLLGLVQGAPELRGLLELIRKVAGASGVDLRGAGPVLDALPKAIDSARALGALMSTESILAEAERLTGILQEQLSPARVGQAVGALESALGTGETSLAQFVSGLDTANLAEVAAARQAIAAAVGRLSELDDLLSRSLGFGEATLVHLDPSRVRAEVGRSTALLASVDTGPIRRAVQGVVDGLGPLLEVAPPPGPRAELDRLLGFLQDKAQDIAASISAADLAPVAVPLRTGLAAAIGSLEKLSEAMASAQTSIRAALEAVRQAVAAVPFDRVASVVQALLAPVNAVVTFIGDLVERIGAALEATLPQVEGALQGAEGAVGEFKAKAEQLLRGAADFIELVQLDQVVGDVADNVRGMANTLAQAQMTPYFDTAVDVIGTTADVFQALPLSLLPDSIKQEVDAAAAPIKAINVPDVESTVEGWFQIGPDGKFTLRKPIEDALADLQAKYDELMASVRGADPRQAIPPIDAELAKIKTAIADVAPKLSLAPVQEAIDRVKRVLDGVDLRAQLQPADGAFQQILAAVDPYSPAALLDPLEQRLAAARLRLVTLVKLEQWGPTLDGLVAQAKGLLDKLNVDLLPLLRAALGEARAFFERVPDFRLGSAFGTFLSSLFSGAGLRIDAWTFDRVLDWLAGTSGVGALTGRAARAAAAVEATLASVQGLDLSGLSTRLGAQAQALRAAVDGLPDGDAKVELRAALSGLDVDRRLGALVANRERYLGLLRTAAADCGALRSVALSAVDVAVEGLVAAFQPLARLGQLVRSLLQPLGIPNLDAPLKEILRGLLAILTPERLAGILTPILGAVKARIGELLDVVVAPLQEGIARLRESIGAVDLAPLREGLEAIYQELRGAIAALAPSNLLAPSLASLDALKAKLQAFDPLASFRADIDELVATANRIAGSFAAEELLREPIRIFEDVVKALEALELENLVGPVLEGLDAIAEQVDTGLDRTTEALVRLQRALPESG